MNEDRINELKEALRSVMQIIIERNGPVTDEVRSMLIQVMEHVATRITQLRQEEPPQGAPPVPEMEEAMPSSNIASFSYDPKQQQLYVQFLGKHPDPNGPVYSYQGIPPAIFELFRNGAVPARTDGRNKWGKWWKGKVPSMGASMFTLIKAMGYPYQRLT